MSIRNQQEENYLVNKALSAMPTPIKTGMRLDADVRLGNLQLNTIDDDGVVWVVTGIDGWWSHPDTDIPDLDRGYADGSYDTVGRYKSRQITLKGAFLTQSPSQVPAARNKLIQATNLVYTGAWLKTEEAPTKASYVRLSGAPNIETKNARGRTEFDIGLRAADPIKYEWYDLDEDGYRYDEVLLVGGTSTSPKTISIDNTGTAEVPCILQLSGPATGSVVIINDSHPTEQQMTTRKALTSDNILELDTREHEAALSKISDESFYDTNGARSYLDAMVDWITLVPGINIIKVYETGNSASAAKLGIYYRSGWLG